jgi:hypothetical protein
MLWIGADNVDVRVRDGVVTLRGELEQRSTADVLTGLVRGVDGVVGVENRLGFRTDDVASRPAAVGPLGVYEEAAWRR